MRRILIHRARGRGLVLLGASLRGYWGLAPTVEQMARLLDLERQAKMARALYVRPVVRVESIQAAAAYRRELELLTDPTPAPWGECAWVVVLYEPTTPELRAGLAAFEARAEATVLPATVPLPAVPSGV
jgi:hypothetical protein